MCNKNDYKLFGTEDSSQFFTKLLNIGAFHESHTKKQLGMSALQQYTELRKSTRVPIVCKGTLKHIESK